MFKHSPTSWGADGVDLNLGCPQRRAREGRALVALVKLFGIHPSGGLVDYNGHIMG